MRAVLFASAALSAGAFDCSNFDCTCQGFVDWYGAVVDKSWGCAPKDAQQWSDGQNCRDECHEKGTACQPSTQHHRGCEVDCTIFGCTCQGFVDWYGATVDKTWGCAPKEAQAWSTAEACDVQCREKGTACVPITSFHPGCGTPSPKPTPPPTPPPTPSPTPSPSPSPSPSPHFQTAYEDVKVGGYVCGGSQEARVFYPVTDKKVPLISFAHGWFDAEAFGAEDFTPHHKQVVSAGYVLIHLESTSLPAECKNEWKDQQRSLEFMKTSPLGEKVDWSKPTGIMGHSMGGGATYHNAAQADAVREYNIGAAVCYNPQIQEGGLQPITNSLVPIFFSTGTADTGVPAKEVKEAYTRTTGVPKAFANIQGGVHTEPNSFGKRRMTEYAVAMMDCHLLGDAAGCNKVYGSASTALCGGKVRMAECVHENEPALGSMVV